MCPLSRQVMIKPQCKIFLVQLSPLSEIHISHKFLTGRITNDQVLNSWRQESQQFQFKFACEWDMQPASAHYSISIWSFIKLSVARSLRGWCAPSAREIYSPRRRPKRATTRHSVLRRPKVRWEMCSRTQAAKIKVRDYKCKTTVTMTTMMMMAPVSAKRIKERRRRRYCWELSRNKEL